MSPNTKRYAFILKGDGFELSLANYYSDKNKEVHKLFSERKYTVGDTDIAYRLINHWDESGLLPEGARDGNGWRKFTLIEMVWLRAIIRLRNFGFPLDKIAKVRDCVVLWNKKTENYPVLEYYVSLALASNADPYIIVLEDGSADIATTREIELSKEFWKKPLDVLYISLKSVVSEMGFKVAPSEGLDLLSPEEKELLNEIHVNNNGEVKVNVDSTGQIAEIESTNVMSALPAHEIHHKIKNERMYGKVVTQYEDGKSRSVKVTKKRRFK